MSTATLNGTPPAANISPFAGTATEGGGGDKYDLCPAGNHPAHLIAIYDLGTHDGEYQGQAKPDQRMLLFAWELPTVNKPDGSPFVIGETYTTYEHGGKLQFGEKNKLRLMLEGWRGKKYLPDEAVDPGAVLGRACLVNVIHKKTKKNNDIAVVEGVKAYPAGMQPPARRHETVAYHVSMGEPPVINWLPKVYYRDSGQMEVVEDVVRLSKEFTGQPIGKAKDTPYSTSAPKAPTSPGPIDESEVPF